MVCESAEEVNARLVLRAILPPEDGAGKADGDDGDAVPGASLLHRRMRAELNEVLESSFKMRLKRIEEKVAILCDGSKADAGKPAPAFAPAPRVRGKARPSATAEVQTDPQQEVTIPPKVVHLFHTAMRRAVSAARPPSKVFGPTDRQVALPDPKEEKEDLPVSEAHSMKGTLDALGKSLSSRERQIKSLQVQLKTCKEIYEETTKEADDSAEELRDLQAHPAKLHQAHIQRVDRRGERVKELSSNLHKSQHQAKHYQNLAQDQRAFFLQGERISASGGSEAMARHPAGDIALVPRPPTMGDEKPEVWDIGTAIANPYVVDSWPFEPNVLANRISKEATMQSCTEETEEDLEEERRRLPFHPGLAALRLPRRMDEDDEYDGYPGQTSTSRSL